MIEIYQELVRIIPKGEKAVLATVVSSRGSAPRKTGAKMLLKEDGTFVGTIGGGGAEHKIRECVSEVMKSGQARMVHLDLSGRDSTMQMVCGGEMDVFLEPILCHETLYLFGAGHISQSVASIGKMLDFRIVVIDPRPEYNNEARFPEADSLITEDYENIASKLNVDEDSYIIIYTAGHITDEKCLRFAVSTKAKYIGMIGSRKKAKEVMERLLKSGVSQAILDSVHSPIGIEIGAETPQEIAISILAEIIKVKREAASRALPV